MALPNPCCCSACDFLAIIISNSNGAVDDNFSVELNGFTLGEIDNSEADFCGGRVFICNLQDDTFTWEPDIPINCNNIVSGNPGSPIDAEDFCLFEDCSWEETLVFPRDYLTMSPSSGAPVSNHIEIWSTQNNLNGNFGFTRVFQLRRLGENWVTCPTGNQQGDALVFADYIASSKEPGEKVAEYLFNFARRA